jgi:hypothetical protein
VWNIEQTRKKENIHVPKMRSKKRRKDEKKNERFYSQFLLFLRVQNASLPWRSIDFQRRLTNKVMSIISKEFLLNIRRSDNINFTKKNKSFS